MFTLVAFLESQDAGGAFVNIAAANDNHITESDDNIQVPTDWPNVFAAMAYVGTTGTRARLVAPSVRQFNTIPITPVNQVLVPTGNEVIDMHRDTLIPLTPGEQLQCEYYADPAAAEYHGVGVWLSSGELSPVHANIRSVQFSITVVPDAGAWVSSNMVLDEELPAGSYKVAGCRLECTAAIFARLLITGASHRPGFPCVADEDFPLMDYFRYGYLGEWGTFLHNQLPKVEILGVAEPGSTTYRGVIDLIAA